MPRFTRRTQLPPRPDDPATLALASFKQELDNNRLEKETANAEFKAKIHSLINDHKSLRKRLTSRQTELMSQAYGCCPGAEEFLGDRRNYEISEAQNFLWDAGDIVIMYNTNTENGKDSHDDEGGSSDVEEVPADSVQKGPKKAQGAKGQKRETKALKKEAKVEGEEAKPQREEAQAQKAKSQPNSEPATRAGFYLPAYIGPSGLKEYRPRREPIENSRDPKRTVLVNGRPERSTAPASNKLRIINPRQSGSQKRKGENTSQPESPENTETPAKRRRKPEPRDEPDVKQG